PVHRIAVLPLLLCAVACTRQPEARQYTLTGQILAVNPAGTELVIHHDDVKGFMPAMTMPFRVKDPALAKGRLPGDLIRATLVVTDEAAWLSKLEKTGWAPLPERQVSAQQAVDLLKPGEAIPDETLVDQDGQTFRVSSLKGSAVLLTFIYTRCPFPEFCPRMDAHFRAVQKAIKDGRLRGTIRLVSLSFDPDFDTPAELRAHASREGADKTIWTFATAPRARIEAWGARLGLSVIRDETNPSDITHNLRTAVIDRQGRLFRILDGNRWTPDEAIAALASMPPS
ncbi:MAG TPA: SCO family protein, partial [Vicinamibacterales bacterium]